MIKEKINGLKDLIDEKKFKEAIDYAKQLLMSPMSDYIKCHVYMFLAMSYFRIDNYRLFIYYKSMMFKLIPKEDWKTKLKVLSEIAMTSHYLKEISDMSLAQKHFAIQEIVKDVPWTWSKEKIKNYVIELTKNNIEKKIKLAYISADIYSHINLSFIIQLLVGYNRNKFDMYVYMLNDEFDGSTEFVQKYVTRLCDMSKKTPEEVACAIADEGIDILVDVSVHSSAQKTAPVIAYKPAPIIIAGIGYMSTSGMKAVDYFITDNYCDPLGTGDELFSEQLVRLPHTHFSYTPIAHVQKFNINTNLHNPITFGSLNGYSKVNNAVLKSWKRIMDRLPESRLILQSNSSDIAMEEMRGRLYKIGLDMTRIEMRPASMNYFGTYNDIDIALDSYPYVGGGTTCDALYMGVPVVSKYGTRHGTRFGYSLLHNVGLGELTARTWREYEDIAVNLARDTKKLQYFHENIRNMMKKSPVMNYRQYVSDIEDAYLKIWNDFLGANMTKVCYNEDNNILEENDMAKLKNKISRKNSKKIDEAKMQELLVLKEKMVQQVADEEYVEAMDTMAEIAQQKVLDVDTMCMGARCYVMTGDNERAIKWINNVLSCDKDNAQARILLGRICLMEDRIDEGIAIFEVVAKNMMQRLTEDEKDEMEEQLDYYRYSDPDMLLEKAPHVAAFLGIESDENEEAIAPEPVAAPAPVQAEEPAKPVEKESELPVVPKDEEAAKRAREAVARLRALLSKHKQEKQDTAESAPAQEPTPEPVSQPAPVEEPEEIMETAPENVQPNDEAATGFDVNGVTLQIMEKPVSLREKVKLFNTFAAGCYVNDDYQSAFELLSAALQLDSEDAAIIKNLAYVCAAAGEAEQAMEFASKLPMIDFAILKNIK